jgi:ankyrin repeat protein
MAAQPVRAGQLEGSLMSYVQLEEIDNVRDVIDKGANVNWRGVNGFTPLIIAARHTDNVDLVKLLIEKGADVNADDNTGQTALMQAAWFGHADVVRVLAEKGADLNAKESKGGSTALMMAFGDRPHANTVRVLIEKGADINARNKDGLTVLGNALFMAAWGKSTYGYGPEEEKEIAVIVRMLRKAGARAE